MLGWSLWIQDARAPRRKRRPSAVILEDEPLPSDSGPEDEVKVVKKQRTSDKPNVDLIAVPEAIEDPEPANVAPHDTQECARLDVLGLASRKTSLNDRGLEEVLDWESRVGVAQNKKPGVRGGHGARERVRESIRSEKAADGKMLCFARTPFRKLVRECLDKVYLLMPHYMHMPYMPHCMQI